MIDFRMQSAMNLWVAETHFPRWKELEELFANKGPDQSSYKTIFNGWQFDTTEQIKKYNIEEWFGQLCKEKKIPVKNIKVNQSWAILYEDGGYQHLHCHGPTLISMVIHLDTQPPLWSDSTPDTEVVAGSEGNNRIVGEHGMLYSIMPSGGNEMVVNNFSSTPGQCVIFDGRVFHGVYPTKAGRRTVIIDFDFDYFEANE